MRARRTATEMPLPEPFVTARRPVRVRLEARPRPLGDGSQLSGTLVTSAAPYGYALLAGVVVPIVLMEPELAAAAPGEPVEAHPRRRARTRRWC